ncbi:hypothetical protein ACJZ2D_000633 [Fusarium nematophilum]
MATEERTFDEAGDTILTLKTTPQVFYWVPDSLFLDVPDTEDSSVEDSLQSPEPSADPAKAPAEEAPEVAGEVHEEVHEGAPEEVPEETSHEATEQASEEVPTQHPAHQDDTNPGQSDNDDGQAALGSASGTLPENVNDDTLAGNDSSSASDETETFRMKVSSRHLILASPVFKEMLAGPFAEGAADGQGLYQIRASEWAPEALTILLDIIHGRHRRVPMALSLEMFAKVAIIVDYYQCQEIVNLFASVWVLALKDKFPDQYGRDSMLWMLVSWVFSRTREFNRMARLAIKHSYGPISTDSIPFPPDILAQIDEARKQGLDEIFSATYTLLDSLCDESACSFECSAMRLGALTKDLARCSLLAPREARPYMARSIDSVKVKIERFRIPRWATKRTRAGSNKQFWCNHSCNVVWDLRPAVAAAEARVDAWELGDSIPSKEEIRDHEKREPEPSCATM